MKSFNKGKLLLIAAAILPLTILEANPGFSRQMDMECMSCHNQTMSQLNTFGRKFAASGFTMTSGSQSMIDGSTVKMGLPSVLNAGVLLKARYIKTDLEDSKTNVDGEKVGTDRGNLEVFKVSKLFLGGKVAENVGGFINYEYDSIGGKMVFAGELGSGYAGVSGYMQNDFGPFSGMEYYNTGLYAPLKLFENRKGTNAAQATDIGHGPATGMQAYYGGDILYAMGGFYVPATSEHEGLDIGTDAIGIGRIAVAPTFGDWTVMVGAYGLSGTAKLSDSALDNNKSSVENGSRLVDITREAYGLDAQVEGNIAGMSTVITLNAVLYNKTELYHPGLGNEDKLQFTDGAEFGAGDNEAFSAEVQVNPREDFGVKVAYLHFNDKYDYRNSNINPAGTSGDGFNKPDKFDREEYSLGLDYSFRQNVRFAVEYTYSDYDVNEKIDGSGKNVALSDANTFFIYTMIGF